MDRKPSRRLRLVLALAALATLLIQTQGLADFRSGTYSGETSQDRALQLKVNRAKTRVTVVFFELVAPPCAGKGGLQYAGLKAKIKPSGRFNAPSPGDGFYGFVKGKFNGRRASGTAKYVFEPSGCDAGNVTWTARKG